MPPTFSDGIFGGSCIRPGLGKLRGLTTLTNELFFSAASLWEISIKHCLGRAEFQADPQVLRRALFNNGYHEIVVSSMHAAAIATLLPIHKDPFDRMLVAQAIAEGITQLTYDSAVAQYKGPIKKFKVASKR